MKSFLRITTVLALAAGLYGCGGPTKDLTAFLSPTEEAKHLQENAGVVCSATGETIVCLPGGSDDILSVHILTANSPDGGAARVVQSVDIRFNNRKFMKVVSTSCGAPCKDMTVEEKDAHDLAMVNDALGGAADPVLGRYGFTATELWDLMVNVQASGKTSMGNENFSLALQRGRVIGGSITQVGL